MIPTLTDARNRAWRTLAQGLGVDVLAAVVLAVGPALAGAHFAWTRGYWLAVAGLAARSGITAVVSYIARQVLPPATVTVRDVAPPR
jgi:hypothetical protein